MPSSPEAADPFTRPACRACTVAAPIAVPSLARVTRPAIPPVEAVTAKLALVAGLRPEDVAVSV